MFFCIGTNMTEAHPVASTFLKNARMNGAGLIVADPRRHALAELADIHCQLKVGTDIAFLNSIMQVLITEDLYDKEYVEANTTGFEEFKTRIMEYSPETASAICGISPEMIRDVARRMAAADSMMLCYTLGITEHTCGTANVSSTANLQMLLGNVGKECGGVNPLRGQNNVQGACDMGALPNVFHGYQKVTDPQVRLKFEEAWGVEGLSAENGLMMPSMIEGLPTKRIRGLYIFGENLANSEPDIHKVERELESADFIVCQDIFPTETTRFADVILPAAAWCEDEGTFTNSERRVSRVRKVKTPPGQARPNWWIFKQLARRFGQDWKSDSAQEIWDNEISVLAPAYGGIKYYRSEGDGIQWPCPDETHSGTKYMHKDGHFVSGKGRFIAAEWTPPAEIPDEEFPLVLSTGRRLFHYHTRTQTSRTGLDNVSPEETADISIADAHRLGISDKEYIKVSSRRGEVRVKARVTPQVPEGMVWMAFHFREACANWLTNAVYDPVTETAEYKACACRVSKL